jgi:3-mercaptopyruvate sulfurtransferase SseA
LLVAKVVPGLHGIARPLAGALGMRRGPFFVFEATSARVALLLRRTGRDPDSALAGGLQAWRDLGYPVEPPATAVRPPAQG